MSSHAVRSSKRRPAIRALVGAVAVSALLSGFAAMTPASAHDHDRYWDYHYHHGWERHYHYYHGRPYAYWAPPGYYYVPPPPPYFAPPVYYAPPPPPVYYGGPSLNVVIPIR